MRSQPGHKDGQATTGAIVSSSRPFRSAQGRGRGPRRKRDSPKWPDDGGAIEFGDAAVGMQCDGKLGGARTTSRPSAKQCQTTASATLIGLSIPEGLQAWWCTVLVWAAERRRSFASCVYCSQRALRAMSLHCLCKLCSVTASPPLGRTASRRRVEARMDHHKMAAFRALLDLFSP
jgi:hypothetical protein